eukprot:Sspe_Gene.66486::Locus_39274_Transcript_1_1_Confidence_1.000_Length_1225::g.66486::m.66486
MPSASKTVRTPLQDLLKIKHPVLLAGMANVATAKLAAAVSNAGGLGVIGGVTLQPKQLRDEIRRLKEQLDDKTAFGVDLLIPQVGGSARKTNYDYTKGTLPEMIDIIIEEKARLFISAVGVPPRWAVEKLHAAGILVANMVGHPKHVDKALDVGVDLIVAQGYEAGGHTGDVGTFALIPQCLDRCKGRTSQLHGGPIHVLAAGGIYDGRTAAAAFAMGSVGLWVGTRFVASTEATASKRHKDFIVKAGPTDAVRTLIYTGRPCRMYKTEIVKEWEDNRQQEIRELTSKGIIPIQKEFARFREEGFEKAKKDYPGLTNMTQTFPLFMGQAAGGIHDVKPAAEILNEMMEEACNILTRQAALVAKL